MNRNCFLKGVMVGKMLKARNAGAAASATASAPSSATDYDKASFLAGLAVGMSTRGVLRWPAVASIIDTRESTTDEMLMELYLMDKLGTLQVPKLPGMTRLQAWMEENNFTDISQYASAKESFGSEIAWEHYRREIISTAYDDNTVYPVDMVNALSGPVRYHFDSYAMAHTFGITLYAVLSGKPTIKKTDSQITITYNTNNNSTACSDVNAVDSCISYYSDKFVPGKYRFTFNSVSITPNPGGSGRFTPFVIVNSNTLDKNKVFPGESLDFSVESFEKLFRVFESTTGAPPSTSKTTWHQVVLQFYPVWVSGSISLNTNTTYTQIVNFSVELIEKYDYESNDHACLTDVLKIADATGLYYLSPDSGNTLKPLLMIDQNEQYIRDRDKPTVTNGGGVSQDIRYPAKDIIQNCAETSITVEGSLVDNTYIHTFSEIDSNSNTVETTMPVESVRYSFGASVQDTLFGSEPGAKNFKPSDRKTFPVRRRNES